MPTIADRVRFMNDKQLAKFMQKMLISGCLMIMKYPGTDRKELEHNAGRIEKSILKFLREEENTRDWSWLNGHKATD